jgi:hypothetical protein
MRLEITVVGCPSVVKRHVEFHEDRRSVLEVEKWEARRTEWIPYLQKWNQARKLSNIVSDDQNCHFKSLPYNFGSRYLCQVPKRRVYLRSQQVCNVIMLVASVLNQQLPETFRDANSISVLIWHAEGCVHIWRSFKAFCSARAWTLRIVLAG